MNAYQTLYSELAFQNLSEEEKIFFSDWDLIGEQLIERFGDKIYKNMDTHTKKIYLSFDDGPDPYCTPQILDILKERNIKTTYSIVGMRIDENIALLKRIHDDGHLIMNHTMHHYDFTLLSEREIKQEVTAVDDKLEQILGFRSTMVRPPYGKINMAVGEYLIELGYKIALWSYNTCDWAANQKEQILRGFFDHIRNGEIVLLHSYKNKENTIAALPDMISGLHRRGFSFARL